MKKKKIKQNHYGGGMKTIVCDIDGTLCEIEPNTNYKIAKPRWDVIEKINKLYDNGNKIYLFTGRHMMNDDITKNWLKKHNVKYHQIFYGKPVGDIYIDDLSITPEFFLENGIE